MPRRSISQRDLDEAAFPIRVKLRLPELGLGAAWLEMLRWLRHELGEGNFARHEAETLEGEALALHFRRFDDASAFLAAFPRTKLADDTKTRRYTAPRLPKVSSG